MRTLALALLLASCIQSNLHDCADGFLCPANLVCAPGQDLCVLPDQLAGCAGKADGAACTFVGVQDATCMQGVCTASPPMQRLCGNGTLDPGEICDGPPPANQTCIDYGFDVGTLVCSASCGPGVSGCRSIGWKSFQFASQSAISQMWGSGPDDVYAVAGGVLFHYNGTQWSNMLVKVPGGVVASVWASGPTDVWVTAAMAPAVMHFDGTNWTQMNTASEVFSVWGSEPNDVYFSGAGIYHYDGNMISQVRPPLMGGAIYGAIWGSSRFDVFALVVSGTTAVAHYDGSTWNMSFPSGATALSTLWGSGPRDVYSAGISGLFHYDGTSWTQIDPNSTAGVWGSARDDVFAVQAGGVLHYDGASWSVSRPNDGSLLYGVWGTGPRDVFTSGMGSAQPTFLHYQGSTWFDDPFPPPGPIAAMWGLSPDDVWAVGDGFVLHRDSGGWRQMTLPQTFAFRGVWSSGSDDVYVVGNNNMDPTAQILHYNGLAWSMIISQFPEPPGIGGVWGSDAQHVYFPGMEGLLEYDGSNWIQLPPSACGAMIAGLVGFDATHIYAYGPTGLYLFDGTQCQPVTSLQPISVRSMWGSSPTNLFLVTPAGIMQSDGTHSMSSLARSNLRTVWGTSASDLFAAGEMGEFWHFDGMCWSAIRYPESMANISAAWGINKGIWFGSDRGLAELVRTVLPGP